MRDEKVEKDDALGRVIEILMRPRRFSCDDFFPTLCFKIHEEG